MFLSRALAQTAPKQIDFARDVHPLLAAKCFACHGGDKRSGGLSLSTYEDVLRGGRSGAILIPGNSKESLVVHRVSGDPPGPMPPTGERLSPNEIAALSAWIDQGARERFNSAPAKPRWVPPMALRQPEIPPGPPEQKPLDRFLTAYFKRNGVVAPAAVGDAAFARRAYLDIWGLLPTPEQLHEFTASRDPHKRERLVQQLLANNKNYAEHWITFWNDLLRNDEGVNYAGTRKSITNWLLKALSDNLPYNEFVSKLLNPVSESDPDGFLVGVNWRGDVSASQTPVMQAAQNTAQVFLGVNLKCNSCHDSFISRWKLKDAYGLAAFFAPEEKLELVRCDNKLGEFTGPKFLYPELGSRPFAGSLAERHAAVAELFTKPENGRFARTIVNRIWERLMGRGIVEPVDDMDAEPWDPNLLDWLASDFIDHHYDLKHLIATIMTSRAYQLPTLGGDLKTAKNYIFRGPAIRRMTAEQFADAVSSITGEWRVYVAPQAKLGVYAREWRLASSPLTRALGRPIRDQVFTERMSEATTLQALEMVNGETLTHLLQRGAKKMLGELPPSPVNLFDSGRITSNFVDVGIDITGKKQLRLLVHDLGSYSPERVLPVWAEARFIGPDGTVKLGQDAAIELKGRAFDYGLRTKTPSEIVYDISGKGYTRFQATVGVEEKCLQSDIMPNVRFFIFDTKPDMERLVQVAPGTPVPVVQAPFTTESLITRVYQYALGRMPTPRERALAKRLLRAKASGLADLLWCLIMLPEFQLIY